MVLKKIAEELDKYFTAITFAESGEFDTAKEVIAGNKKVLLALTEKGLDEKTFLYAINTCKRLDTELDILYIPSSEQKATALNEFLEKLKKESITYNIRTIKGNLKQEIINYTTVNKNVLYVVVDSSENLDVESSQKDKGFEELLKDLRCPLVVIKEAALRT